MWTSQVRFRKANWADAFLLHNIFYTIYYYLLICLLTSVKNLWNTIPSLNNKISEVENLTSQFSPINNISESIRNIKELIEQARDAANKVRSGSPNTAVQNERDVWNSCPYPSSLHLQIAIPMRFSGNAHVELRPPTNLDDLRAYTSLSLSLQRPAGRGDGSRRRRQVPSGMFVLYLGNRDVSESKWCEAVWTLQCKFWR